MIDLASPVMPYRLRRCRPLRLPSVTMVAAPVRSRSAIELYIAAPWCEHVLGTAAPARSTAADLARLRGNQGCGSRGTKIFGIAPRSRAYSPWVARIEAAIVT